MYCVYVLKDTRTDQLYYGYTNNIKRRLGEHNPADEYKLVYYEAYLSKSDAQEREKKLKHYGQSRARLKQRIKSSLAM